MRTRTIKWIAGLTVIGMFSVIGYVGESKAVTSNLPSLAVGASKTTSFTSSATNYIWCNTDSTADAKAVTTTRITQGSVIYGFKLDASAGTNVSAGIYDVADVTNIVWTNGVSEQLLDELTEATQFKWTITDWVSPRKLANGFTLIATGAATTTVYHD